MRGLALLGNVQAPALYVTYLQTQGANPAYKAVSLADVEKAVTDTAYLLHTVERRDLQLGNLKKANLPQFKQISSLPIDQQVAALDTSWNGLQLEQREAFLTASTSSMVFPRTGMSLSDVVDALPRGTFDFRRAFLYTLEDQNPAFLRLKTFRESQSGYPSKVTGPNGNPVEIYGTGAEKLISASMIDTNNPKAMPAMVFRQPGHTGYERDLSGANTGVLPYGVYLPWDKLFAHLSPATKWTESGKPTQYGDPIGISGQSWRVTNGKKAYFASPQNESTVLHILDGAMDELDEARRKGFLSDSDLQSSQPEKSE